MKKTFKIIIYTLLTGLTVLFITYKSILGAFGLGIETIETLKQLKQSQKSVQRIRQAHAEKKRQIKIKHIKRGQRRLASAGASIVPVVGSIVVAGAVVKFSLDDYCEDQKELIEQENLLFDTQHDYNQEECWASARNEFYELVTQACLP